MLSLSCRVNGSRTKYMGQAHTLSKEIAQTISSATLASENDDKNFENRKLVEFVEQELPEQRMQNIMALSKAALP